MKLQRAHPCEDTWEWVFNRSENYKHTLIEPFGDNRFCDGLIVDKLGRMALYEVKASEELFYPHVIERCKEKMRFLNCGMDFFLLDGHPAARWYRKLTRNPGMYNKDLDIICTWSALGAIVPKARSKKHNIMGHTFHPFCGPDWFDRPANELAEQVMDPADVALMNEVTGYYQRCNTIPRQEPLHEQ